MVLTDFQHAGVNYHKDERVFEEDDTAKYFCDAGWAKDETGEFQTGKPNGREVTLELQGGKHSTVAAEPK